MVVLFLFMGVTVYDSQLPADFAISEMSWKTLGNEVLQNSG